MPNYEVQQGDCMSSIARQFGFFPDTLWNRSENAQLKLKRKDPNVLFPGDIVFVPDKTLRQESAATDQGHTYKVKGVPAKLKLRFLRNDKPRANERYVLEIDGKSTDGTTDGDGGLEASIPPDAKQGKLTFVSNGEEHILDLGHLDPIDTPSGIQARLHNMGFYKGEINGTMDDLTKGAIAGFQKSKSLDQTGNMDSKTTSALKDAFGS